MHKRRFGGWFNKLWPSLKWASCNLVSGTSNTQFVEVRGVCFVGVAWGVLMKMKQGIGLRDWHGGTCHEIVSKFNGEDGGYQS